MTVTTAEKIETIVLSRTTGNFGTFTEYAPGRYRVVADGLTVLVRCGDAGWHVSLKGFEAIDPDLYVAAKMALEAGAGVSATRHTDMEAILKTWT